MKAIETIYKNYRFCSRLEARWAYFFDLLTLKWEYEPEGFDIDGEWYLPDFKVTSPQGIVYWYEIKPSDAPESAKMKAFEKAYRDKIQKEWNGEIRENVDFATLCGDPYAVFFENKTKHLCPRCGGFTAEVPYDCYPNELAIMCYPCDFDTPCGGGQPTERGVLASEFYPHKGTICIEQNEYDALMLFFQMYAEQARRARFEHGETPVVKSRPIFEIPKFDEE